MASADKQAADIIHMIKASADDKNAAPANKKRSSAKERTGKTHQPQSLSTYVLRVT